VNGATIDGCLSTAITSLGPPPICAARDSGRCWLLIIAVIIVISVIPTRCEDPQ